MEYTLSLAALRSLPISQRRIAIAASNGTGEQLLRLFDEIATVPESISRLFLPAFFAHLDLIQAERMEQLEELTPSDTQLLRRAVLAIQGVAAIHMSNKSYPELWPPLWHWSRLIMKHQHYLPAMQKNHLSELHIIILRLVGRLNYDEMRPAIRAAPGFRQLVAKVWTLCVQDEWVGTGFSRDHCFELVIGFLQSGLDLKDPKHQDDVTEGCGGSLVDFADVLVNSVLHLASDDTDRSFRFLSDTLFIIVETEHVRPDLSPLLLDRGLIRALVVILSTLSLNSGSALDYGFRVLISRMAVPLCQVRLAEALEAGLLAVLASALGTPGLISAAVFEECVLELLRPCFPYRSVLVPFHLALLDIATETNWEQSPLWDTWYKLHKAYTTMLATLQLHVTRDLPVPLLSCHNVACDSSIRSRKSCSSCESMYYCSVECQRSRSDWLRGHRQTCTKIRARPLNAPDPMTSRDRSFLRTLVYTAWKMNLGQILLSQLDQMLGLDSDSTADLDMQFVTFFQFVDGQLEIATQDSAKTNDRELFGSMWDDQLARAAASQGRLHLAIISIFRSPGETSCQLFALRRSPAL
ncbi:hypothetical protein FB45DRAFT_124067 [Roridomyces roridus]|uniref:MYND-type domain-containing protein n=1 Tax=Roridomyces roridus TaxID=1738132 RepID=A0AAD7BIQ3_9AGAR|nr:hypothetical protein FB45DRAFT_124067 [Roridomyces roridus]